MCGYFTDDKTFLGIKDTKIEKESSSCIQDESQSEEGKHSWENNSFLPEEMKSDFAKIENLIYDLRSDVFVPPDHSYVSADSELMNYRMINKSSFSQNKEVIKNDSIKLK